MKRKVAAGTGRKYRLSVSLDEADYAALHRLAGSQKPPLSDSYVAAFAIRRFIEAASKSTAAPAINFLNT
jgi:hypothetical protein